MNDVINILLSQSFLTRALVVGVLVSLCCALLGVSLVLKRFSMIGDGLSHVGFGAMAIACAAGVAPLYFSIPVVLIAAFLLLRMNEKGKIKGDAAIALISTGALAVGIMVTSMTTGMNVDIYNYMFGSILTMTNDDVVITSIVSVVIIALFVLFYNEIFAVTFDESFARATGTRVSVYNMLIAGLTAVTIVIGMRMMGALLISSLIIFPAVTSMRLCKSFRSVIISSTVISVLCFVAGLVFSVQYEAPTGASVVCVNICVLLLFMIIAKINTAVKNSTVKKLLSAFSVITFAFLFGVVALASVGQYKQKEKLTVITTGFASYDFAKQIVRDKGEVKMLLSPGEESHTYEPTPTDIVDIKASDVFICGGGESESWAERILHGAEGGTAVIRMMDITHLEEHGHEEHKHEEGEEGHGEYDEHVWTSPVNAKLIVNAICEAICSADSENEAYYRDNAESYLSQLDELDGSFRSLGEKSAGKYAVIADRFPLRYLMLEYGINYVSAYPGCSAQVEVNPVTIANINNMVKNDGIPVVFKVDLSSGTVAYSVSDETGSAVDTLYSCHVISADDLANGETYISLMTRNLKALERALDY